MKSINKLIITPLVFFAIFSIQAQGFVNLNFNSAQLSGYAAGFVPTTNALPGWTVYYGVIQQTTILYDETGDGYVSLLDVNAPYGGGVIPGNIYTVVLAASGGTEDDISASISQTAVIPATAQYIVFTGSYQGYSYSADWQMSINGQVIPVTQVSAGTYAYDEYEGNISAYAGQNATLTFTALGGTGQIEPGDLSLDDIYFSSNPVPEPGELALAAIGLTLLGLRRWRKISL